MAGKAATTEQLQIWHGSEESKKTQHGDILYTRTLKLGISDSGLSLLLTIMLYLVWVGGILSYLCPLTEGFCPGGFCPEGLCPGGLCPGGFCPFPAQGPLNINSGWPRGHPHEYNYCPERLV